jgi:hypothetical protein
MYKMSSIEEQVIKTIVEKLKEIDEKYLNE